MIVLRKKTFTLPTFGIKNVVNAAGFGSGATMSRGDRFKQGLIGAGKLGTTAAIGGSLYLTGKFLKASKKALTGRMGEKEGEVLRD